MAYAKVNDTTFSKSEQVTVVYDYNEIKQTIAQLQEHLATLQGNIAVTENKIASLQALLAEGEKVGVAEKVETLTQEA